MRFIANLSPVRAAHKPLHSSLLMMELPSERAAVLELVVCTMVVCPLIFHLLVAKRWSLPSGKRMRAALIALPVCLALETLDPLVGFSLAVTINIAFLRRALFPSFLSRSQTKHIVQRVTGVGRSKAPWSNAAGFVDEQQAALKPSARMPQEVDDIGHAVLDAPLVETAVAAAMDLIEEHLGAKWLKCFPSNCVGKSGSRASSTAATARNTLTPPSTVGVRPTTVPELTPLEQRQLALNRTILKRSGTQALAAQRVRAPAELVWATLHSFTEWPKMVDNCVGTEVYSGQSVGSDAATGEVKAKVTLGVAFVRVSAHVHHVLDKAAGRSSWTLDKSKTNDVVENTGCWLVRPDQTGDANACVIYYSANVQLAAWAPAWVNTFVAEQGLPKAVGWLRREAEKRYQA